MEQLVSVKPGSDRVIYGSVGRVFCSYIGAFLGVMTIALSAPMAAHAANIDAEGNPINSVFRQRSGLPQSNPSAPGLPPQTRQRPNNAAPQPQQPVVEQNLPPPVDPLKGVLSYQGSWMAMYFQEYAPDSPYRAGTVQGSVSFAWAMNAQHCGEEMGALVFDNWGNLEDDLVSVEVKIRAGKHVLAVEGDAFQEPGTPILVVYFDHNMIGDTDKTVSEIISNASRPVVFAVRNEKLNIDTEVAFTPEGFSKVWGDMGNACRDGRTDGPTILPEPEEIEGTR